MKKTIAILFLLVFLLAGGVWFFKKEKKVNLPWLPKESEPTPTSQTVGGVSFEESRQIAEEAVRNAPTYKFDGFDLKFEGFEALYCPSCWEFIFSFKSRAAGYGDRRGKGLAQVITPHTTRATVENGRVTSVVTDQTFDELTQRFLK